MQHSQTGLRPCLPEVQLGCFFLLGLILDFELAEFEFKIKKKQNLSLFLVIFAMFSVLVIFRTVVDKKSCLIVFRLVEGWVALRKICVALS